MDRDLENSLRPNPLPNWYDTSYRQIMVTLQVRNTNAVLHSMASNYWLAGYGSFEKVKNREIAYPLKQPDQRLVAHPLI